MPTPAEGPYELLLATADPAWLEARRSPAGHLVATATLKRAGGRAVPFTIGILLADVGGRPVLHVREIGPSRRLPRWCPDRHIVLTFCLGYPAPQVPRNLTEADAWWRTLYGFLEHQLFADLFGVWEEEYAWPHGPYAAEARRQAELLAHDQPAPVVSAARLRQVPSADERCPCGSGSRSADCHLAVMTRLVALAEAEHQALDTWWKLSGLGRECCGRLKSCRLRPTTPLLFRSRWEYRDEEGWHPARAPRGSGA